MLGRLVKLFPQISQMKGFSPDKCVRETDNVSVNEKIVAILRKYDASESGPLFSNVMVSKFKIIN